MRIQKQSFFVLLAAGCFLTISAAADVRVTAEVQARAPDGTALADQPAYPEVELASGESGSLHIGREFEYPVWNAGIRESFSGAEETVETRKLGMELFLTVLQEGNGIAYSGETRTTILRSESEKGVNFGTTETVFRGQLESGELVEVVIDQPNGDKETIKLFFESTEGDG